MGHLLCIAEPGQIGKQVKKKQCIEIEAIYISIATKQTGIDNQITYLWNNRIVTRTSIKIVMIEVIYTWKTLHWKTYCSILWNHSANSRKNYSVWLPHCNLRTLLSQTNQQLSLSQNYFFTKEIAQSSVTPHPPVEHYVAYKVYTYTKRQSLNPTNDYKNYKMLIQYQNTKHD